MAQPSTSAAAQPANVASDAGAVAPADAPVAWAELQALGAERLEPVAWAHLQALARRSAVQPGPARQWLDARLQRAAQALRARLLARPAVPGMPRDAAQGAAPLSPLGGLLLRLNGPGNGLPPPSHAPALSQPGPAPVAAAVAGAVPPPVVPAVAVVPPSTLATPPTLPALKSVQRHQGTWARLSAERRLARSLAEVPAGSGPLNSQWLLQRALQRLQALSPAYLQHFVAQADALLWLERASGAGTAPVGQVLHSEAETAPAKPRRKPRAKTSPKASGPAPEPGSAA
jgi:hypothetical protein